MGIGVCSSGSAGRGKTVILDCERALANAREIVEQIGHKRVDATLALCRHLIAQASGPHMITAPDLSAFLQPAGVAPPRGLMDHVSLHEDESIMTPLRQRMIQDMQVRNLSPCIIDCYVRQVALFGRYFNRSPELLGLDEIRAYQLHLVHERKLGWGSTSEYLPLRRGPPDTA